MIYLRGVWVTLLALLAGVAQAQIAVDGNLSDWAPIPALYEHEQDYGCDSPLGRVAQFKAAADEQHLYALIAFEQPRPFLNPARPQQLRKGVWDDLTYLELDVNDDGRWDYRTQLSTGKRFGMNNLAVLEADPAGHANGRFLYPEGHKNYIPLGPRAWISPDTRAIEMRLPRTALGLVSGRTIALRVYLHYRDTLAGSGKWVTEYYPPRGRWVPFTFGPPLAKGAAPVLTAGAVMLPLMLTPEGVEAVQPELMGDENTAQMAQERPWRVPSLVVEAGPPVAHKGPLADSGNDGDLPEVADGTPVQPLPRQTGFAPVPEPEAPAALPGGRDLVPQPDDASQAAAAPQPAADVQAGGAALAEAGAAAEPLTAEAQPLALAAAPGEAPAPQLPPALLANTVPTPTPTPAPTATATPIPSPLPTRTPSPLPTATPAPTTTPLAARQLMGSAEPPLAQEPVAIDGGLQDWKTASFTNPIAATLKSQAGDPVAQLDRISVAMSTGYLYVRLDYPQPRQPGRVTADGQPAALEQAGNLLRIDIDSDGEPDFEVRLLGTAGQAEGAELVNRANERLLKSVADPGQPGMAVALGADGRTVELRLPRQALGLGGQGKVRLQAVVRYRPAAGGAWHLMAYPGMHSWFACVLR